MKGGEAKFWNELRIPLRAMGDVDRLESHATSIGRPDVNICLDPGVVWDIELKYSDNGRVTLRPAQRMWFTKRIRVKGNVCVLTKAVVKGVPFYLFNKRVPDGDDLNDWVMYADHMWDDKIDFAELEEIFRAQKQRETSFG